MYIPIEDLDISIRAYQALNNIGIKNLSELSTYYRNDSVFKKFNRKTIDEIEQIMIENNIQFINESNKL